MKKKKGGGKLPKRWGKALPSTPEAAPGRPPEKKRGNQHATKGGVPYAIRGNGTIHHESNSERKNRPSCAGEERNHPFPAFPGGERALPLCHEEKEHRGIWERKKKRPIPLQGKHPLLPTFRALLTQQQKKKKEKHGGKKGGGGGAFALIQRVGVWSSSAKLPPR